MDRLALKDKKITVMGLGVHGGAVGNILWLNKQGAIVTVTDLRPEAELKKSLDQLRHVKGINYVLGEHRDEDFVKADIVLRNPAVPRRSKFLQLGREAGAVIEMDSSLFFKLSPTKHIVGITGSKGKTTTTEMVAQLMGLKYAKVAKIGVEGTSPLEALDKIDGNSLVVFELSSWRLEAMDEHRLSPHTSIITSLYRDHLNTYDGFDDYLNTKKSIFRYQSESDRAVLNFDDEIVRSWADEISAKVAWYSLGNNIPGDGVCVRHGRVVIQKGRDEYKLFSLDNFGFKSDHGRLNTLAAVYLAFCEGALPDAMANQIRQQPNLAHRMEKVSEIGGVTYVNDSAATIPDALMAAVRSLRDKYLVLILGGGDKRLEFENLAKVIARAKIRALIWLPGTATQDMKRDVEAAFKNDVPVSKGVASMPEAVAVARNVAEVGDVVLLSPGATSFGLFEHEFDRGNQFKQAVKNLESGSS